MKKHCLSNCNHNVLQVLSMKLDLLWRYEQYLKDAKKEKHNKCAQMIMKMVKDDAKHVKGLRDMIIHKCEKKKFK